MQLQFQALIHSQKWFEQLSGGADGTRTRDLLNAIQAFSQLNYSPTIAPPFYISDLLNGIQKVSQPNYTLAMCFYSTLFF